MFNPETNKCLRRLATTSLLSLGFSATAAVNDVLPADFFPLASGTTTFAVYAYDRQFSGPYSRGNKLLDGELSS